MNYRAQILALLRSSVILSAISVASCVMFLIFIARSAEDLEITIEKAWNDSVRDWSLQCRSTVELGPQLFYIFLPLQAIGTLAGAVFSFFLAKRLNANQVARFANMMQIFAALPAFQLLPFLILSIVFHPRYEFFMFRMLQPVASVRVNGTWAPLSGIDVRDSLTGSMESLAFPACAPYTLENASQACTFAPGAETVVDIPLEYEIGDMHPRGDALRTEDFLLAFVATCAFLAGILVHAFFVLMRMAHRQRLGGVDTVRTPSIASVRQGLRECCELCRTGRVIRRGIYDDGEAAALTLQEQQGGTGVGLAEPETVELVPG